MSWEEVQLGELLVESRIPADNPDPNRRIRVKLHVEGVEKRPLENEMEGATKQFIRRAGQFIYGKQNFHKGAFGIVPDELDGFETSADIPSFDVREDCLPEWIYYFFKSGNRYLQLEKLARGVGSQRIHPKQIYDIAIPLPPKEKQWELIQNIINTESKFYDFAGEQSHQLALVKKLRQQILQDAVQGKLVPQDPNDEPASKLLERIKAEKEKLVQDKKIKKEKPLPEIKPEEIPFEIPENWEWCRLGEMFQIERGSSPRPKGDPRYFSKNRTEHHWIKISDFNLHSDDDYLLDTSEFLTSEGVKYGRKVTEKDIIIAVSGSVGRCSLMKIDGYIYDGLMAVKNINDKIVRRFLHLFFKFFESELLKKATGAIWQNINTDIAKIQPIPIPPINEQSRILLKVEQFMTLCDELEQSIQQNQKYTKELLQVTLKEALEPKTN